MYRASTAMFELTPQEVVKRHVKQRPHLAEAVSLATLFATSACFSLTADGTLKETRPTGCD